MSLQQQALRYGQRRATGRLARVIPWIGTGLALVAVASAIRRKGLVRGAADSALNALPVVGGLKSIVETMRGRDFIADRA